MLMVIDASALLSAYFPDEETHRQAQILFRDYTADLIDLMAPAFARYEIMNACYVAARRARFKLSRACEIACEILDTGICRDEEVSCREVMKISDLYGISTYDGIYMAKAIERGAPLITADRKLFDKIHSMDDSVLWIGDYRGADGQLY